MADSPDNQNDLLRWVSTAPEYVVWYGGLALLFGLFAYGLFKLTRELIRDWKTPRKNLPPSCRK
jgi:hypothetical protein